MSTRTSDRGAWIPVSSQGVVIDDGGTAVFAVNAVEDGFPADLDGIPFEELDHRIGKLIAARS